MSNSSSSTVAISDKLLGSLKPTKTFNYHKGGSITSLDFDDSGQYLISSGVDKSIQLYDIHKGIHSKSIQSQKYGSHLAKFTHKDLDCLYVSTPGTNDEVPIDNAIRYLSLGDKKYIRYFKGHDDQVIALEVDPVHDMFSSASVDGTVKLWDFRTSNSIGNINVGQASLIAYDPHGIVMAVATMPVHGTGARLEGTGGRLEFYDVKSLLSPFLSVDLPISSSGSWTKLEFSNTGKLLLISTNGNEQYIIDAFLGKLLTILSVASTIPPIKSHYPNYGNSCFTPDGKFVMVGSSNCTILIFDLSHIKSSNGSLTVKDTDNPRKLLPLKTIPTNQGVPKILSFNPKLFTLATADNSVSLWQP